MDTILDTIWDMLVIASEANVAEWISAISSILNTAAAIAVAVIAGRGLAAWRGSVIAAEELKRREAARALTKAMKALAEEIGAIRAGRVPPSAFETGVAVVEGNSYKVFPPGYYIATIDRLTWEVSKRRYEAAFFIPAISFKPESVFSNYITCAKTFRDAFAQFHFDQKFKDPINPEGSFSEQLDAAKIKMVLNIDQPEGDPYKARLHETLFAAVKILEPYIDGRPE